MTSSDLNLHLTESDLIYSGRFFCALSNEATHASPNYLVSEILGGRESVHRVCARVKVLVTYRNLVSSNTEAQQGNFQTCVKGQ